MTKIRPARGADATQIAAVKAQVWPNEYVDVRRIEKVVEDVNHVTHVAEEDGCVVGFVDGFITRSETGILRWEVDLLAVQPECRRRGVATQLIRASGLSGRNAGATFARALINVDNIGSRNTFAGCGYQAQSEQGGLFVCSSDVSELLQSIVTNSHVVSVRTINYHGLWVEGEFSVAAFKTANVIRARQNLDLVGAVIPAQEISAVRAACTAGYQHIGQYQYWIAVFGGS